MCLFFIPVAKKKLFFDTHLLLLSVLLELPVADAMVVLLYN